MKRLSLFILLALITISFGQNSYAQKLKKTAISPEVLKTKFVNYSAACCEAIEQHEKYYIDNGLQDGSKVWTDEIIAQEEALSQAVMENCNGIDPEYNHNISDDIPFCEPRLCTLRAYCAQKGYCFSSHRDDMADTGYAQCWHDKMTTTRTATGNRK